VHLEHEEALRRVSAADHATLATVNRTGSADLVPVCFAIVDGRVAIPIDTVKPKDSTALGRVDNLERDPRATLLAEHWDAEDWSRLWWVRLSLRRRAPEGDPTLDELVAALRGRYRQYGDATFVEVLVFDIERVSGWSAA
jgi:PPOX class probable F420-dependent enzyme